MHGQLIMTHLQNAFLPAPSQHLNDVACSKPLAGADHCGEDLLGYLRGVKFFARLQANVAAAAVLSGRFFSQISQQELSAA